MVQTEQQYFVIPREDGLIFCISPRETEPKDCKLAYDKGEHAVFYRNVDDTVILDYINPVVRDRLAKEKQVAIAEVDFENDNMVRLYRVNVSHVTKCVIDPKTLADLKKHRQEIEKEAKKQEESIDFNSLPLV